MAEDLIKELKELNLIELIDLYERLKIDEKKARDSVFEVTEADLKPKRTKKGSKNK